MVEFRRAADELAWRFLRADSVVGIKGQAIGGAHVGFDVAAAGRMHESRIADGHRHALERRERIDAALRTLNMLHQLTIRRAFEPFGRASAALASYFTVYASARPDGTGTVLVLLQIALRLEESRRIFEQFRGSEPTSTADVLELFEGMRPEAKTDAAVSLLRTRKPLACPLAPLLVAAREQAFEAIGAYADVLAAQESERRARQQALLSRELGDLHTRLWGSP